MKPKRPRPIPKPFATAPSRVHEPAARHACAVPGCRRHVPTAYLMCYGHWQQVPSVVARHVMHRWHWLQRMPGCADTEEQYQAACRAAVAAVAAAAATPHPDHPTR